MREQQRRYWSKLIAEQEGSGMRRSFDGLPALVCDHLQLDPFVGHLYLFATR